MSEEILEIKIGELSVKGNKRMLEFFVNNYGSIVYAMKNAEMIINTKVQQMQQQMPMQMPMQAPNQIPALAEKKKDKIVLK